MLPPRTTKGVNDMAFTSIVAPAETSDGTATPVVGPLAGLSGAWVGRGKKKRRCYSYKRRKFVAKRNCQPSRRTRKPRRRGRVAVARRRKGTRRVTVGRAFWKSFGKAGKRCVKKQSNGMLRLVKSSACGGKRKGRVAAARRRTGSARVGRYGRYHWKSFGKAGKRCVATTRTKGHKGFTIVKSSKCKGGKRRSSLRGFEGMDLGFDFPVEFAGATGLEGTPAVAILADAEAGEPEGTDLGRYGRRRKAKSHCTAVKRDRKGHCACAHRAPGKGKRGAFAQKCDAKHLSMRKAPRRRGSGLRGYESADQEFLMGDQGLSGTTDLPRKCSRFVSIHSEALGRDVKVCADLGGVDDVSDGPLAGGGLARHYGFGMVGGGLGPAAGVVIGAVGAAILNKFGASIPGIKSIPWGGVGAAALAAAAAAYFPKTRAAGIGALTGVASVVAYKFISGEGAPSVAPSAGYSGYRGGLGAIVPELGAIVPEMGGMGQHIDVMSGNDGGMGDGVDVLAGAFGSLPFAGAM